MDNEVNTTQKMTGKWIEQKRILEHPLETFENCGVLSSRQPENKLHTNVTPQCSPGGVVGAARTVRL
jgi:hypothetical protein